MPSAPSKNVIYHFNQNQVDPAFCHKNSLSSAPLSLQLLSLSLKNLRHRQNREKNWRENYKRGRRRRRRRDTHFERAASVAPPWRKRKERRTKVAGTRRKTRMWMKSKSRKYMTSVAKSAARRPSTDNNVSPLSLCLSLSVPLSLTHTLFTLSCA